MPKIESALQRKCCFIGWSITVCLLMSITGCLLISTSSSCYAAANESNPDVLFIAVDDLNDWIDLLDANAPIRTPNLRRLAARGVNFTRAYCASPACNPSRAAVLLGLRPSSTGVYGNKSDWRGAVPNAVTLPRYFINHGYRVEGCGKIFHHHLGGAFHDDDSFHDFTHLTNPPDAPMPPEKLNGLPGYGTANTDWGAWPPDPANHVDVRTVDDALARLKQPREKPLFLAVGIFRPHMPYFAPEAAFAEYPADSVVMPPIQPDDRTDLPTGALALLKLKALFFRGMMRAEKNRPGTWSQAVGAYQACATFADAQIGRLLDALDETGRVDRTIVVLWSDHGYHLGEKEHWEKFALWETTTHVPLIVVAPGVTKESSVCDTPVSLLDIYPTLVELAGLPSNTACDGTSLVPLLRDPTRRQNRVALMTYQRGNHAVRSRRWRYIRYADGTEELYDHGNDPYEWTNLAAEPDLAHVLNRHRRELPRREMPAVPDLTRAGGGEHSGANQRSRIAATTLGVLP